MKLYKRHSARYDKFMTFVTTKYLGLLLLSSLLTGCSHDSMQNPPRSPKPHTQSTAECLTIAGRYYANSHNGERRHELPELLLPENAPYDKHPAWVVIEQSEEKIAVKLGSQNDVFSNTILIRGKDYQCTRSGIARNWFHTTVSDIDVGTFVGGEWREVIFSKSEDGSLMSTMTVNSAEIGVLGMLMLPIPVVPYEPGHGRWLPINQKIPLSQVYPDVIQLSDSICRSADNGDLMAQKYLGDLYYKNSHFSREYLIRAYVWYKLASRQHRGIELERIDIITHMLTPEELMRAQQELANWKPGQCADHVLPADVVQ